MRKLVSLILLGFILLIAVISNPEEQQHQTFLKQELKHYFEEKMQSDSTEQNALGDLILGFGKLLGGSVIEMVVKQKVSADNYVFFSLTKMRHDGEDHIIGMGIFGNNILFKDVEEVLEEGWLNEKDKLRN